MKRLCTLCLALVMSLTCLAAVPAQGADLASVQGAVQALGIMTGDENGNMNLTAPITRAQFYPSPTWQQRARQSKMRSVQEEQ